MKKQDNRQKTTNYLFCHSGVVKMSSQKEFNQVNWMRLRGCVCEDAIQRELENIITAEGSGERYSSILRGQIQCLVGVESVT